MRSKLYEFINLVFIFIGLTTFSCADLEVENLVEPDAAKALANPEDLISLAGGAFRTLHNAMQGEDGPALSMAVMADQSSCSWGNAAMNDLSSEPRSGWINSITYQFNAVNRVFWESCYSAISSVNDALFAIEEEGIEIGTNGEDNPMVRAWSYFVSGVAHGYIGLTFDQGNVIFWDTDLETVQMSPWSSLIDASIQLLDQAIAICEDNQFITPDYFIAGRAYTSAELGALANSYAARILAYSSRNKTHNESINWSKVLAYTQKGIEIDMAPNMGGDLEWYCLYTVYQIYPGYGRIDHRIINLMDNDYPSRWPNDNVSWTTPNGQDPGEASSDDARLASDFQYLTDQVFRPERGYYHYSHYRYSRYDWFIAEVWDGRGPKSSFYVMENELLKAEALIRANSNVAGAIAILNSASGTRIARAGLPPINGGATATEVLEAIFYERDIELIDSGMGIGYFDMRRRDMLQRGTILHFPVPASELEILQIPNYTVTGAPDGENISNGSWTGKDGLISPLSR
jgi:hypothetical protein